MIKPLRKRHFQIWSSLAILLPAAIIAGWLAVPRPASDTLVQPVAPAPLPLILAQRNRLDRNVILRASTDSKTFQLEWIEKTPLTTPSALVYAGPRLLGRIGPQGVYRFAFRPAPDGKCPPISVYDIIHHRHIEKITF